VIAPRSGVVVRLEEPLGRHAPLRVGGRCDAWVVVHREAALVDTLADLRDAGLARTMWGAGTRLWVRDGGLAGAVVRLGRDFEDVTATASQVVAGAAAPLARLARFGPPAWARLAEAPGSVGASILHDAAWEPWVTSITVVARGGLRTWSWADLATKGGSPVVVRVHLRRDIDAPPPGRDASWLGAFRATGRKADLERELRVAALRGVRLRQVLLPPRGPATPVNLGGADARDVGLLLQSMRDRLEKERGTPTEETFRWAGRA
jgi:UDP-N-acetylenolpyruvoylglucosamine reductase